jgi:hypothetical protein
VLNKPLLQSEDCAINQNSDEVKNEKSSIQQNEKICCFSSFSFCECITGKQNSQKYILQKKELIAPDYQKISDIMKMIKIKKERISKTSYYDNPVKLKEYYVKMCKNFSCYGSILFIVREIVSTSSAENSSKVTIKKAKRILAIKSNKISLVDYKTKQLIRSQRISDVKSWCSGNNSGQVNCGPVIIINKQNKNNNLMKKNEVIDSFIATNEQLIMNSIDVQKLFSIEFRSAKWQLYIDDQSTLKSITCLLLDQSLDLGIDNNPLMLDLTITGNFNHNRKKSIIQKHNNFNFLRSKSTNRSFSEKPVSGFNRNVEKSFMSNAPVGSSISGFFDELSSDYISASDLNSNTTQNISVLKQHINNKENNKNLYQSNSTIWINQYQYYKEFEQLQSIIFWFPEEAAYRLTEIEYELFKSVKPIEYLRHVSLDAGNLSSLKNQTNDNTKHKTVQDLIIRYKEVSSWIKKLIQSQESPDKRLAITLSCIRCAITCWNIGNFNSAREIWLGLKYNKKFYYFFYVNFHVDFKDCTCQSK